MSTVLLFSNNTITTYLYEPFSYTIFNPNPGTSTLSTTKTSGIPASYLATDSSALVVFSTTSNGMLSGTQQFIVSNIDACGSTIATSTNNINILVGRFVDSNHNSFVGSNYTFYAKEAIPPIKLNAPFNIGTPTSKPSLPPGMGFSAVDGSSVSIIGTPPVTVPQSNYLIIGKEVGTSKTVSSTISFVISNERIVTTVLPDSAIINMVDDVSISNRTLTAKGNGTIQYTWPSFPDGIFVTDNSSNPATSGFMPSDPSYTMIITGTPTFTAITQFKNAGYSDGVIIPITAQRISPAPSITSSIPITFKFAEAVLFDPVNVPHLYDNVALDPSANFFRAQTYFNTTTVGMSSIYSSNLRTDLSLAFNGIDRAYLFGIPVDNTGVSNYTIRAINSNGKTRDLLTTITVLTDTVSFSSPPTPAIDTCYSFVLTRPLESALPGYYPTPITFSASAASRKNITWTESGLAGTGLSLSATTGNSVYITGKPAATTTGIQSLTLTASSIETSAVATTTVNFEIINDVFTFVNPGTLSWIQNKPITPIQIVATALSGRQVISYSATGLPSGVSMSSTGRISGTPIPYMSGGITVIANTGYTSGSNSIPFPFTVTADSLLLVVPQTNDYIFSAGDPVSIKVSGSAYSGAVVSNYSWTLSPTYGLNLNPVSGLIGGAWTTSIPPNIILPSSCNFAVNAHAGTLIGDLSATFTTSNVVTNESFMIQANGSNSFLLRSSDISSWDAPFGVTAVNDTMFDIQLNDYTGVDNNVILVSQSSGSVWRGDDLTQFTRIPLTDIPTTYYPSISSLANKSGTSTWWGIGTMMLSSGQKSVIYTSSNDGVSWDDLSTITSDISANETEFYCRDGNATPNPGAKSAYVTGGAAMRYKDYVLMIGGLNISNTNTMLRSVDYGVTWNVVAGGFQSEVGYFSLDASTIWIATGSDRYITDYDPMATYPPSFDLSTNTIRYSTDMGSSWNIASGGFNMFGYEVAYASNTWLATGVSATDSSNYTIELRTSSNGINWSNVSAVSSLFDPIVTSNAGPRAPLPLGSLLFDGTYWNVVANYGTTTKILRHDLSGSLTDGNWINIDTNLNFGPSNQFLAATNPRYIRPNHLQPTTIRLHFDIGVGAGPTITSPMSSSILLYQYVPMSPIVFTATGTGPMYFFAINEEIPDGLAFDPVTNILSGTPAQVGNSSITFYAKDDNGVTIFTLNIKVILASITRQQDGAGAWTSLVRQYTEVNAATTARDNRATPAIEYRLGEFTSPTPPSVITAPPKC